MRDHEIEIAPHLRQVMVGCRLILQTDEGLMEESTDFGDVSGWVFWESSDEQIVIGTENPNENIEEIEEPGVIGSRKRCPASSESQGSFGGKKTNRVLGAWMASSLSIVTDVGVLPLLDKEGNIEINFVPKKIFLDVKPDEKELNIVRVFGQLPAIGTIGIIFQGSSPDGFEYIFVSLQPASGLTVDHNSDLGLSTNLFTTKEDGTLDQDGCHVAAVDSFWDVIRDENNAKVVGLLGDKAGKDVTGFMPTVWREQNRLAYLSHLRGGPVHPGEEDSPNNISGNVGGACLDTNAFFFQESGRVGKLKFTNLSFPTTPEELANIVESRLVLDNVQKQWRIITDIDQDLTLSLGRVRWDFDGDTDLSECLVFGEEENIVGWVDTRQSLQTKFQTAGNNTAFVLRIISDSETRLSESRPLFVVDRVSNANDIKFTYVKRKDLTQGYILFGGEKPWEAETENVLLTTITIEPRENILPVQLTREWNLIPLESNNLWFEIVQIDRGIPFICAPIRPTLFFEDETRSIWESLEGGNEGSISTYELVKEKVQDGMLNCMYPGGTPINRFVPSNSFSFTNKNTDHSLTYRIISYSEETGIIKAIPVWDKSGQTVINVAALSGRQKAKADIVGGYDVYFAHRVGDFNSEGFDSQELREENQSGHSWVSFFFEKKSCPVIPLDMVFFSTDIEFTRVASVSNFCIPEGFVSDQDVVELTNLQLVVGFNIFSNNRVNDLARLSLPVFIVEGVNISSFLTEGSCDTELPGRVFSGQTITIGDNDSPALLILGQGNNFFTASCCEEDETEPDPEPEPEPEPDTEPEPEPVPGFFETLTVSHIRGDGSLSFRGTLNVDLQNSAPFTWTAVDVDRGFSFNLFHTGSLWQYRQFQTFGNVTIVLANRTAGIDDPVGSYNVIGGTASTQRRPFNQAVTTVLITS